MINFNFIIKNKEYSYRILKEICTVQLKQKKLY